MATNTAAHADPLTVTTTPDSVILDFGITKIKPSKFNSEADGKLSARVLFAKGGETDIMLRAAEEQAKSERWGKRPPVGYRAGVQDGDAVDGTGQRLFPDYYAGKNFITAKSSRPVTCWVGKERRTANDDDFYSGMLGLAVVKAFTYDRESRGCGWGLNLVWKTGPGERITTGGVDSVSAAMIQATNVTWSDDANTASANLDDVL